MRSRVLVVGATAVVLLSSCSADEKPADRPSAVSGASGSASSEPSRTPNPTGTEKPDVEQMLAGGVAAVLESGVVDFRQTWTAGSATLVDSSGRVFLDDSWRLSSTFRDPEANTDSVMEVRAVDQVTYMQVPWKDARAGCWLRLERGEVPVGQLAMTPGQPMYVGILDDLRADAIDVTSPDIVLAGVPLESALRLLSGQLLEELELTQKQLREGKVPVRVFFDGDAITDVAIAGTEIANAIAATGTLDRDLEPFLRGMRVSVRYRVGPAQAERVVAPDPDLVFEVRDTSCRS